MIKATLILLLALLSPLSASAADCTTATIEYAIIPDCLYDKFQNGDFAWGDIFIFGIHLIRLLLALSGLVAVILLMYGGLRIIFGTISDDKESGKNTIKYTLMGFVVILLAWIIVDLVVSLVTNS